MTLDKALKLADVAAELVGTADSGRGQALITLAAEVRRLVDENSINLRLADAVATLYKTVDQQPVCNLQVLTLARDARDLALVVKTHVRVLKARVGGADFQYSATAIKLGDDDVHKEQ